MVPVADRPVMEHLIMLLRRHGVREVAANLHHHPRAISEHFGDGRRFGLEMRFLEERELLGTAGGVGRFRDFFAAGTFLVTSGDGLTDIDFGALLAHHRAKGGIATLAVKRVDDTTRYGVVVHDADARVVGFQEKPSREDAHSNLCNCGIYVFEPAIFDYIPAGAFVDFAMDVFPALLAAKEPFHVFPLDGYWNDVGTIDQYRQGNMDALTGAVDVQVPGVEQRAGVWVGDGSTVAADATIVPPVVIGERCAVGAGASLIGPAVVGHDCVIGHGARVAGSVLWDRVHVGHEARTGVAILAHDVVLSHGAVVHDGAVVGEGCRLLTDARVPADARLEAGTTVDGETVVP
jgi:mannose-1-phosphate guanylyltransferase/mannose-1-phosphate guanylyltransferase/phosphomannomutase